ncbi:MAG: hypothetical protein KJ720_01770 [Proteobacteria bacterium]|nr:hypothetical protein [Pseudomonadota bacterium]MBU1451174.1 hypothetical protein [Pseudomonadota bacterium]MBU2469460.1 hypothetical protein [Pseudomonadota bacterium]MBU2517464.1 hypothetical protein [Pseudomonadota bacterium]
MKSLILALLCGAVLLLAGSAHAFAIYNHVGHEVCAQKKLDVLVGSCSFMIPPNGHHNGAHGSGWSGGRVVWATGSDSCRGTDYFDIPDGGYARIYNGEVKIYKHDDKQVGSRDVSGCDCPDPGPDKKKP